MSIGEKPPLVEVRESNVHAPAGRPGAIGGQQSELGGMAGEVVTACIIRTTITPPDTHTAGPGRWRDEPATPVTALELRHQKRRSASLSGCQNGGPQPVGRDPGRIGTAPGAI